MITLMAIFTALVCALGFWVVVRSRLFAKRLARPVDTSPAVLAEYESSWGTKRPAWLRVPERIAVCERCGSPAHHVSDCPL